MAKVKLIDVIEIEEHNNEFILLKVVGEYMDLLKTGVLNGDEVAIRVNKGDTRVFTIFTKNGHLSYHDGARGYTLISETEERRKRAIIDCIENDLETSLSDTNGRDLVQDKKDIAGKRVTFTTYYTPNDNKGLFTKKNDKPFGSFEALEDFIEKVGEKYEDLTLINSSVSQNGYQVKNYEAFVR